MIGGGVNGPSIAYALAAKGVSVVLVDKGALAGGVSGRSSALVRMHYDGLSRFAQGKSVEGPRPYAIRADHLDPMPGRRAE